MDVDVTILWMVCANAWGLGGRQVHLLEQMLYMNAACQPCIYGYMTAANELSCKILDASSMDAGRQAKLPNCMEIQCIKSWHLSDSHVRCRVHQAWMSINQSIFRTVWKFDV